MDIDTIRFEIDLRITELGRVTAEAQELAGALRVLVGQLGRAAGGTSATTGTQVTTTNGTE